jgi:hypothetical protein
MKIEIFGLLKFYFKNITENYTLRKYKIFYLFCDCSIYFQNTNNTKVCENYSNLTIEQNSKFHSIRVS